jgi:hypothetical protein
MSIKFLDFDLMFYFNVSFWSLIAIKIYIVSIDYGRFSVIPNKYTRIIDLDILLITSKTTFRYNHKIIYTGRI